MFGWRICKYDPRFRDDAGRYLKNDWVGAGQIGEAFADGVLTIEEYRRVEELYVSAAIRLWTAAGEPALLIQALETGAPFGLPAQSDSLRDVGFDGWRPLAGAHVGDVRLVAAMTRWCLRDFGWCELVSEGFRIGFGYDYYMTVETTGPVDAERRAIAESGLFVEPFEIPG